MPRQSIVLLAWCLIQLCLVGALQKPHFNYTRSAKLLLSWDEVWEVSDHPALAVLKTNSLITIWLRVAGDTGTGLKRMLTFRCPKTSTKVTIDLDSVDYATTERCEDTLSFVIAKSDFNIEKFTLRIGESRLSASEVFKESLELAVRVEFTTGGLESSPLRIWNLDKINAQMSSSGDSTAMNLGPLTAGAVSFATSISSNSDNFTSIDFLNYQVVNALAEAPMFFRSKLNLGMILFIDSSSCLKYQLSSTILFVNYHSKMDVEHQKFGKLAYLNLKDGKLWYSTCGLSREVKKFYEKQKPTFSIGICTITALTGDAEPYVNIGAVREKVQLNELSYQGCNAAASARNCKVVPNVNPMITLLSGMENTAIVCPIICNDLGEVYRFYRDDKPLMGSINEDWSTIDGLMVSKTGNIIKFPPTVSASHSGVYRCEAGLNQFSFNVTVVSMPLFVSSKASISKSGLLPKKVFAMEGESLLYNCTVTFASLNSVRVTPVFYVTDTNKDKLSWKSLRDEEFRDSVGAMNESFSLSTTETANSQTLSVTVKGVPPPNPLPLRNFSHRFECSASVDSKESQLAGMSEYKVQSTRTEVVFVPRLKLDSFDINPSNNCSVQRCLLGKGAFFEFALSSSTVGQLKDIGVDIISYIRLDNVPLTSLKVLFRDNATSLEVDNARARLAFQIYPVSSHEIMTELVARHSLTAVFNLRYRSDANLGSLMLLKAAYGKPILELGQLDCRADPLCFYSTDFDADGLQSFLTVALTFKPPPELPQPQLAGASALVAGIIVGILLFIIGAAIVVYLASRKTERTYDVAELELKQGYNPQVEVRAEMFGEYQRPGHLEGVWEPTQPRDQLSLISGLSGSSAGDQPGPDDIDFREFGEQGSFIGNYKTDPKNSDLLGTPTNYELHF